jgi:cell division protein FtsB
MRTRRLTGGNMRLTAMREVFACIVIVGVVSTLSACSQSEQSRDQSVVSTQVPALTKEIQALKAEIVKLLTRQ